MLQGGFAVAALVEGMGGVPAAATGLEARLTGSSIANVIGDDSALHDLMMFGEDDLAATPDAAPQSEAKNIVLCSSASGHIDMCASCASEVRESKA